jgi:hypothetical protein
MLQIAIDKLNIFYKLFRVFLIFVTFFVFLLTTFLESEMEIAIGIFPCRWALAAHFGCGYERLTSVHQAEIPENLRFRRKTPSKSRPRWGACSQP